jgi:inhibitor of cysteine peptidase
MKKLAVLLLLASMLSSTCDKSTENVAPNLKATYTVGVHEDFTIVMKSNPTTGYSWRWVNSGTVAVVDSIGESYVPDKPMLDGSGGKEVWKFRGVKTGRDTLIFEYCRPWDPQSTADTNIVVVKVL